MEKIYEFCWSHYVSDQMRFLKGPEVPDWDEFCNSLIPAAARAVLNQEERSDYLGWSDINEEVFALILLKGYEEIGIENYYSPMGFLDPSQSNLIPEETLKEMIKINDDYDLRKKEEAEEKERLLLETYWDNASNTVYEMEDLQ